MNNVDKRIVKNDPLQTLINYKGYYKCPVDSDGNFLGPLVAYAGDYTDDDGNKKNFVGDTYFNIAKVEPYRDTREYYSRLIMYDLEDKSLRGPKKVVGMPMGGIKFSQTFGDMLNVPSVFAEKKVLELADPEKGIKERSEIIIARHEILRDEEVYIFEDLCNNFSTTKKAVEVIESYGAKVTGIACVVNRASLQEWNGLPVVTALFKPSPQYKQEDPKVSKLVQTNNVIWKAKYFWDELKKFEQGE